MRKFLIPSSIALACAIASPAFAQSRADQVPTPSAPNEAAQSQQQPKTSEPPKTLTGEWGGLRTRIRDAGIDISAGYVSEFGANVSGGAKKDATETGQFTFGAKVNLEKLVGLQGGTFQTSVTFRRGHNLSDRAGLGTLQQVQEVYGRGQTWRLTEFYYQQQLGDNLDLKVGRLTMGGDFNSFSCDFMNLSFCGAQAGNLAGDYWYNWPISQWAGRVRYKTPDWYVMVGAYENNTHNLDNAFYISRHGAEGVLIPGEFGWTPKLGSRQLPGSYRVGGWYNSADGTDVLLDANHRPSGVTGVAALNRSGRYGAYVLMQQQLTGSYEDGPDGPKATHGLSVFLNITQTDRKTERTDNQIAGGLFYVGPFKARPDDDIGFAIARTNVNGRAARNEKLADPLSEKPDAEYASELYYSVHLAPWLIVRPNVQYIVNPGGYHDVTDVVVLGAKSAITF